MRKFILIISIYFISSGYSYTQNVKGFYVNGFATILGNTAREDSLLLFAQNNGFNYLTLYDVYTVNSNTPLTNITTAQTFANFINKAKTQYGITEVGVAAENYSFFSNVIHVYNQQHPLASEKVDVYNLEFEFWISSSVTSGAYYCTTYLQPAGYSCDTAGAFAYYKKILKRIDSLANSSGQKSEAYFGFFNSGQGRQIVETGVDRVMLSVYITSANYSSTYQYNYIKPRLQYLASASSAIKVMPLYSSEPSFMQTWAGTNPFFQPFTDLSGSLVAESGSWKNYIQPEGIQWFAYSFLPKKNMTTSIEENKTNEISISVSPNPSSGIFKINMHAEAIAVITDMYGKEIKKEILRNQSEISLEKYSDGFYFLNIMVENKNRVVKLLKF